MSAGPAGTPWNAQQREWLQAMGLEVWVPVAAAADEPVGPPGADRPATAPSAPSARAGARPTDVAATQPRTSRDEAAPSIAAQPGAGRGEPAQAAGPRGPLLRALLRAARRDAVEHLGGLLPENLDALARDPAAKRALWPRLRALRRGDR